MKEGHPRRLQSRKSNIGRAMVPKAIAKLFSLKSGNVLAVSISTPKGETLYHGFAKLDSAITPYEVHVGKRLTKGKEIKGALLIRRLISQTF